MKERPILMSAPMVRAILDGTKTQTRRVIKPQPTVPIINILGCPYGMPGDRLWVRETWQYAPPPPIAGEMPCVVYKATDDSDFVRSLGMGWRPSIFMPRWASRITLEVTAVRVERLWNITSSDCHAEGIPPCRWRETDAIVEYSELWDRINGKRFPWASNPWVWVVQFRVIRKEQDDRP